MANAPIRYAEVLADDPALKNPNQDEEKLPKNKVNQKTSKQVQKERHIKAYEEKKRRINKLLTNNFQKLQGQESNMIVDHTCCQRLCRQVPGTFDVASQAEFSQFTLVRDPYASYPNFENFLYMSLDFDLVICYILWFFLFDHLTNNPVLSIFIVYLIEKCFR